MSADRICYPVSDREERSLTVGIKIENSGSALLVYWSEEVEQYFADRKIFPGYPWRTSKVYAPGQKIRLKSDVTVEQYSNQPQNRICEFGAFSYCRTPQIDLDFSLGRFCSVGTNIRISNPEHPAGRFTSHPLFTFRHTREILAADFGIEPQSAFQRLAEAAPLIGNDVRIGDGATIARGVKVGDGAIIRPNTVVTEDVPAFAIVGGNPAQIIAFRFDSDELRARMLASRWWDYHPAQLPIKYSEDVPLFLKKIESMKASGELPPADYSRFSVGEDLLAMADGRKPSEPSRQVAIEPPTWQDYMEKRIKGREKGIPWFLHDKLKCYEYLERHGVATIVPFKTFTDPKSIDLSGLPDSFVVKPSLQSSTKGVMVLTKQGADSYWDEMKRRSLTLDEIREEQEKYFLETKAAGKCVIVEPKIFDLDPEKYSIPRDFKAYAFHGEVGLMLEIDRNTKPSSVSWFDGNFEPITDERISCNESYVQNTPKPTPSRYREILDLAKRTSKMLPTPFARVDMYLTDDGPKVGEITLAPGGLYYGTHYSMSKEQQRLMGKMWRNALGSIETTNKA